MKFYPGIVAGILLLILSTSSAAAQGTVMSWTVDGVKREALVFAPPSATKELSPLVFAWHGHGGNMQGNSTLMRVQTLWKEAVVVYPQGLPTPSRIDPQGSKPGWQGEPGQLGDRDLKFFDAMLKTIEQKFKINEKRVYSMGFSNGSLFNYLLWGERGKLFAAFGICAGRIDPAVHINAERSVIVVAGKTDQVVLFTEQEQAIQTDRQVDNATGQGQQCGPICTLYPSTSHTPVVTIIHPGGHIFPPFASPKTVDFFQHHELP